MIPIRTSVQPHRTPYMNFALIAANILIFLLTYRFGSGTSSLWPWAVTFELQPSWPYIWQFVSYAFLHGGLMHILGNMYFLYIFGNNVNDRLGHIGYLAFYLAGAVFSAIGHITAANILYPQALSAPVIGASGAVAAVTGAYLVLFPQTLITVFYWFYFFVGTIDLPAIYLIILKMILIDNVIIRYTPGVAYDAHLAGYSFGIAAIFLMLVLRLTDSDEYDLWQMVRQWNRRRQYRNVVAGGADPFLGRHGRRAVKSREVWLAPGEKAADGIMQLREEITKLLGESNIPQAARVYLQLMQEDSEQILPRQQLLDIANHFMSAGSWEQAAAAYNKFLKHYSGYQYAEQVELMLGIIYARYLVKPDMALKHLEAAMDKLNDENQKAMCKTEIEKLKR